MCIILLFLIIGSLGGMICQHESLLMRSEVDPAISLESIATNAHYSFKCKLKALDSCHEEHGTQGCQVNRVTNSYHDNPFPCCPSIFCPFYSYFVFL